MNTRISRLNREILSTNGKMAYWRALPRFPINFLKQFLNSQIKKKLYSFASNNLQYELRTLTTTVTTLKE